MIFNLLFGYFNYLSVMINVSAHGEGFMLGTYNFYFFFPLLLLGAECAVFAAFFIGSDNSFGTVRNKIIIGKTKTEIYLNDVLITFLASILLLPPYFFAALSLGYYVLGADVILRLSHPLACVICVLTVSLTYSALSVLISRLITDRAVALFAAITVFAALLIPNLVIYSRLQATEFVTRKTFSGDTWIDEEYRNPKYLTGEKRKAFETAEYFCPLAYTLEILSSDGSTSVWFPLAALGESAALTAAGVAAFRRKNVR